MPIYEYKCEGCGETFELIQKFSDEPLTTHEKCGGPVHRLLSAPALQFKGSGWYITDYAKGGTSTPKTDAPKSDSSNKTSTDTTAASSEAKSQSPSASSESSKSA